MGMILHKTIENTKYEIIMVCINVVNTFKKYSIFIRNIKTNETEFNKEPFILL